MPLSSVVELATVNRSVKGSNPLEAANYFQNGKNSQKQSFLLLI